MILNSRVDNQRRAPDTTRGENRQEPRCHLSRENPLLRGAVLLTYLLDVNGIIYSTLKTDPLGATHTP